MFKISYLVKLLIFLIGLVVVLEAISYIATRLVINKAVTQNAHSGLMKGGELFSRIMQKNVEQLALSVKVLTEDFGFKDAVASNDEKTIRSALVNHSARVKADIGILLTRDGKLIASDEFFSVQIIHEFNNLKQQAEERGQAYDTVIVDGTAYQFVFFAVKAPVVIGWVGMGFEVKKAFSDDLKRLTDLEISFLHYSGQEIHYLSGTLDDRSRLYLLQQLKRHPQPKGVVFEYDGMMSLQLSVARQNDELIAVLQVPLSEVLAPFSRLNIQLFMFALAFSALAGVAALFLARSVTRPVSELADIARRIAKGSYTASIQVNSTDEFGDLASAFISMQQAIGEREKQVIYQSEHDPLTGLPNRICVFPQLSLALECAKPLNSTVYALIIDIKNFTQINDELSQEIGDLVLRAVGEKISQFISNGKTLRLGSDEFLCVLNYSNPSAINQTAEGIHELFKLPLAVSGIQVNIDVNIGLANYPWDADSVESLLRRATLALNQGRAVEQRTCFYQAGWDEIHLRRLHLFREFEGSLVNKHISLHYQPKINLERPQVLGAEALVRWNHPELGFISPDEFIGVIESSGQITLLTRWVLKTAIVKLQQLLNDGVDISLSVNLSALDLLVDDLPQYVAELLRINSVPAERLCLEITESAIMREADKCLHNLKRLEALGIVLSIDDFGTGYSSLSQLKKLPVSELKIDKSFILHLDANEDDQLIVRSTIDLGHTLGLSVTAEGVETESIKNILKQYGCDTAQGYLYSKPLPEKEFSRWVHNYLLGLTQ